MVWLFKHLNNDTIVDIWMFFFFFFLFLFEILRFIFIVEMNKNKNFEIRSDVCPLLWNKPCPLLSAALQ